MAARSCGKVKAGTVFFPRSQFADEKSGSEERERLVVIPATPRPDLIIGQPALAFTALQAFLNAMFGIGDAGQFRPRRLGRSILR
jgi:hypothetical protein